MDLPTVVSLCLATVGAITGGVGLAFSWRSVKASERSAAASEVSAQAASDSVSTQIAAWNEQKRARLEWVDIHFKWELEKQNSDAGTFTVALRNEGLSPAYGTVVAAFYHQNRHHTFSGSTFGTFDDAETAYRREFIPEVMAPGDVHLFHISASRADMGNGDRRHVTFRVHYRDALGQHSLDLKMWFGGEWGKGFVRSPVSKCIDGEFTLIGKKEWAERRKVEGEFELPCPYA